MVGAGRGGVNGDAPTYDRRIATEHRRTIVFAGPADPAATLAPLRRGPGDPCFQFGDDGAIWRTSRLDSGAVTARITRVAADTVACRAWGEGAEEFLAGAPALLGADDDPAGFAPAEPVVAEALRKVPNLRLGRTQRVLEALIPAVLEQRVPGTDAFAAWRRLVTAFGDPAPGPAPERMRVPPSAAGWRAIPSWEFHRANVDGRRAATIVEAAGREAALQRLVDRPAAQARAALETLPGIGVWTAAETAQRAFGDADALSIGDYNLAKMIGWTLLGHPIDDPAMVALLEPLRPHRYRAVRLLQVAGLAVKPRRGPRLPIQHIHRL